jgi:phosphate transport system permease protein
MLVKGLEFISPKLIFSNPSPGADQSQTGGFLAPIEGTLLLTLIGTLIALPLGVGTAVWIVEYGRPAKLARAVETGIEVVAGTPSVVLGIFGLLLFTNNIFSWMSFTAQGGSVAGRSFLTAGTMMSLLAMPLIFTSTREALLQIPAQVREASYALGKTKWTTIRRVLVPGARPGILTGSALGMGRIAGDTAIVVILLGATLQIQKVGSAPVIGLLRGSGSTLTSYVYNNSPAGEGNAPQKAYAAAFVLLILVLALNFGIDFFARRSKKENVA